MKKKKFPKNIFSDFKKLLEKDDIEGKDISSFKDSLESDETKNYLEALIRASQPEQALRESFFTNNSTFAKYLFQNVFPEVSLKGGFVDYLIKADREEIGLEIKPLYLVNYKDTKSGKILKKLQKKYLNPEDHKNQILKYLRGDKEYVVLTNLDQWFLYSKSYSLSKECPFFAFTNLFDLLEDFKQVEDFWKYLDKKEDLSIKEPLDQKFYKSLKEWVNQLEELNFKCSDDKKTELIISLLNKLIFIQSLDKFWVIKKDFIKYQWEHNKSLWGSKNKKRFVEKFFEDINVYFYELYDTELFLDDSDNKTILDYLDDKGLNIEKFFRKLHLILGIGYGKNVDNWITGLTQYNFRRIDEDILGKTYETYLAEIRKEQGIFYTPRYITKYIVEQTLNLKFQLLVSNIIETIEEEEFSDCSDLIDELFSIKILDSACGSGSFLIKALKTLWGYYNKILNSLEDKFKKYHYAIEREFKTEEIRKKFTIIQDIQQKLFANDMRKLISKIILNHLYGVDLDEKALNIAKLNIWLEAIKLSPKSFQHNVLPSETNHILLNLKINLNIGNSLIGLPFDKAKKIISTKLMSDIQSLYDYRDKYLEDPKNIVLINSLNDLKLELRAKLDESFEEYLEDNKLKTNFLSESQPFHWVLEFWFNYFNKDGKIIKEDNSGFDIIIGNPPWGAELNSYKDIIEKQYESIAKEQYDSFQLFLYHSIRDLLKNAGFLGYIIPNELCLEDGNVYLRDYLLNYTIHEISNLGYQIFEDVTRPSMVLAIEKRKPPSRHKVQIFVGLSKSNKSIIKDDIRSIQDIISSSKFHRTQESFQLNDKKKFDIFAHPFDKEIKELIQSNNFKPFKEYFLNGRGIDTNKNGRHFICPECGILNPPFGVGKAAKKNKDCVNEECEFIFKKEDEVSYETEDLILDERYKEGDHNAPGYIGEDLHRYFFSRKPRLIKYYGDVLSDPEKEVEFFKYSSVVWKDHELYIGEKLLFRKVSSRNLPQVMVYPDFLVTNQQIYIFKKKQDYNDISIFF
ncbi:MAG: N-6 DNA methylase, partial [Candidatus Lokiarchaeota archaeon]|nr:N-6 DNA methylase [Candidatus Lokiarchaeota archaeon]MBD3202108.1 N-6 DNA methylase [Candidatus Lokiarchaeota archaeon]